MDLHAFDQFEAMIRTPFSGIGHTISEVVAKAAASPSA
jgi:hypothetical protein